MMNGRLFLTAAALLLAAGCAKQDLGSAYRSDLDAVRILAQVGGDEVSGGFVTTRSVPVGKNAEAEAAFKNGDRISVTASSQKAVVYTLDGTNWTPEDGKFLKWVNPTMDFSAYYPVAEGVDMQNFAVPSDQSDEEKIASADYMTCPATSVTRAAGNNGVSLAFQRKMARIVVEPTLMSQFDEGYSISQVTVCGNTTGYSDGSVVTGNVEVTAFKQADDSNQGVKFYALLSPTEQDGESVFLKVALSDGTLLQAKGIPETAAGNSYTVSLRVGKDVASVSSVSVTNWTDGSITGGAAKLVPYVTFSAASEQEFNMTFNGSFKLGTDEYFEYSVGGGNWTRFTATVSGVAFGGDKGNLRLRGKSSKGTGLPGPYYSTISFSNDEPVKCTGDIRTLINYDDYSSDGTNEALFCSLFENCSQLTSAPELPATKLSQFCYFKMFQRCTALETAPALPAETLADYCYANMFYGCKALETAPALNATTLKGACYQNMFYGCTKLSSVTMLATDVSGDQCLDNWLTDAGTDASSRTLTVASDNVYTTMVSKGYVPELWKKADIIASDGSTIGAEMSGIPYVTFSAASEQEFSMTFNDSFTLGGGEYFEYSVGGSKWVRFTNTVTDIAFGGENNDLRLRGKSSKGTAPYNTTYSTISFSKDVPVNCTGDIRTLIDYTAYSTDNIGTAKFCYLFKGCTQLTSAPELPATTFATFCYEYMFSGCTALTTAPELPATNLANYCYRYMFDGCTSLETAPALKATSLPTSCYKSMFYGCTKLSSVTMLATDVSGDKCLDNWLTDAGTKANSRTLTLASETVYNTLTLEENSNYLPDNWKQGASNTTVKFQDSSSTE